MADTTVVPITAPASRPATYLGLTEAELRAELESGKSLADVAKAEGKTVAGLKAKLKADLETKLDAAVKTGRITQAQANEVLVRMTERLDDMIEGTFGDRGRHGGSGGCGPPPGASAPSGAFIPAGSPA